MMQKVDQPSYATTSPHLPGDFRTEAGTPSHLPLACDPCVAMPLEDGMDFFPVRMTNILLQLSLYIHMSLIKPFLLCFTLKEHGKVNFMKPEVKGAFCMCRFLLV